MRIDDDGSGFDAGAPDFPGLGLKLMEYRARLVGGVFRLEMLPNSGTRIAVTMPARAAGAGCVADGRRSPVRTIHAGRSP
jgi:glucose-6-phosphate-specific signal transduction histidine kinase